MKTSIFKPLLLLLLMAAAFYEVQANAAESVKKSPNSVTVSKDVKLDFIGTSDININVLNKYGDMSIVTTNTDSVVMTVHIEATGPDRSEAEDVLDRVKIDYSHGKNYLSATTSFNQSENTFVRLLKSFVTDIKSSLVDENNVRVNYELRVPKGANLDIDNKFGNITLGSLEAPLNLSLSHGNLQADKLNGMVDLDLKFGNSEINFVKSGKLSLKYAQLSLDEAGDLSLNSTFSELRSVNIKSLNINSKNDKLNLAKLDRLSGKLLFTTTKISSLEKECSVNTEFGHLTVMTLSPGFELFKTKSHSTEIRVVIDEAASYSLNLTGKKEKLSYDEKLTDLKTGFTENGRLTVTGLRGNTDSAGKIEIEAGGGEVFVR